MDEANITGVVTVWMYTELAVLKLH
jgi:hypothetical protein